MPSSEGAPAAPVPPCDVEGCAQSRSKRDRFCAMHRKRLQRTGKTGPAGRVRARTGEANHAHPDGYRRVNDPLRGGYGMQHRVVMERLLGRPLHAFENVHHINGRRDDNRPENLELWLTPQPKGQRALDLALWVVDTYPDLARSVLAARDDREQA